MKKPPRPPRSPRSPAQLRHAVETALAWLKHHSSTKVRAGMARYGLPSEHALGVAVGTIQQLAKELGPDHELADALWETGVYEARLLVAFIGEPERLTAAQMDRWVRECDNWGVVDTLCFKLFDRSPLAWKKIEPWTVAKPEFVKRAGVVLLACLAGHDEDARDDAFLRYLPLVEQAATDERNFVKKGVSWALRRVGRRSPPLHAAVAEVAQRLVASDEPAPRWIGRDTLRELTSPAVLKKLAAQRKT